jgi:tRNA (guanine-N7-)-methyltransferase
MDAQAQRRPIRSYVLRAGRIGPGQARALSELGPRFVVPFDARPLDAARTFGRDAPLIVEIGFGMGHATVAFAAARPDVNLLGVEVHAPGVGSLLAQIDAATLGNVRIVQHDAVEVIASMIASASLAGVHLFFPDPWPKKRHHKRRLIQAPFAAMLGQRLAPGGYLHLATDWEDYAQQMREVLDAVPGLVNSAGAAGFVTRPDSRPVTKFESRGLRLGHVVRDLVYRKV